MALAFALYASLRDLVGSAWASAAVAGVVALIALVLAVLVTRKAQVEPAKGDNRNLTAQLLDLARERPLVAVGVVGAVAAVVIRNPRVLSAVVAGLFASRATQPKR